MNCDGCACVFQRPSPLSQVKHATTSAPRSFHHFLCFTSNLIACHSFIISFVSLSLFSLLPHNSNRVMSMWCLISALHSLILLLHLQSNCLSFIHHFFRFSFSVFHSSSPYRLSDVNVMFVFSISLIDLAPSSPILLTVIHSSFLSVFFLIFHSSSLHRSSDVNVVFVFSISLIAFAPSSPILFPVIHSSFLSVFFLIFHSSSLHRSSDVNVVFDFSISLIDLAPSSPISFPVNCPSFLFFSLFSLLPHLSDLVP